MTLPPEMEPAYIWPGGSRVEQINTLELHDVSIYPDEHVLKKLLGSSWSAYSALLELFDENGMTHEWRYYRDGKAWLCKVQKGTRTIVWMSAWKGFVRATLYFPERLAGEVPKLGISEATIRAIAAAKKVGKSTPCMFDIRDAGILEEFEKVMNFKICSGEAGLPAEDSAGA